MTHKEDAREEEGRREDDGKEEQPRFARLLWSEQRACVRRSAERRSSRVCVCVRVRWARRADRQQTRRWTRAGAPVPRWKRGSETALRLPTHHVWYCFRGL